MQKHLELEAEVQRRLTKAVPFMRGRLCQELGLRYAPEIRFYRDNTVNQVEESHAQARKHLEGLEKDKMETPLAKMMQTLKYLMEIRTLSPVQLEIAKDKLTERGD